MTYTEAIEILRKHNEWRRYDGPIDEGPEMADPKLLGEAIDTVVNAELTWLDIQTIIAIYEQGVECGEYRRYNEAEWMKLYSQDILRRFNKTNENEQ